MTRLAIVCQSHWRYDLVSEQLVAAKDAAQERLEIHRSILTDLDELGEIMSEMLERQQIVEVRLTLCLRSFIF